MSRIRMSLCLAALATFCLTTNSLLGEPNDEPASKAASNANGDTPEKPKPLSVEAARERAKLLHTTYEATLIAVHRAYFEGRRDEVPAVVLEDVFKWVDKETRGKTRWIAVNTEAMNVDHEPKSEIEKKAAKSLADGNESFEHVENGVYHRAGSIALVAGCLRCHESGLIQRRQRKRVAGLVISMPVKPSVPAKAKGAPKR